MHKTTCLPSLLLFGEIRYFVEWAVACASSVFGLKYQVDVMMFFFQKMKLMRFRASRCHSGQSVALQPSMVSPIKPSLSFRSELEDQNPCKTSSTDSDISESHCSNFGKCPQKFPMLKKLILRHHTWKVFYLRVIAPSYSSHNKLTSWVCKQET